MNQTFKYCWISNKTNSLAHTAWEIKFFCVPESAAAIPNLPLFRMFIATLKPSPTPEIKLAKLSIEIVLVNWDNQVWHLTHFSPMFHFYTPWKRQKTLDFLTFSVVKKWNNGLKWVKKVIKVCCNRYFQQKDESTRQDISMTPY